jgi:hypothetical protein
MLTRGDLDFAFMNFYNFPKYKVEDNSFLKGEDSRYRISCG